jgi:hypothetical protein
VLLDQRLVLGARPVVRAHGKLDLLGDRRTGVVLVTSDRGQTIKSLEVSCCDDAGQGAAPQQ